MGSSDGWLLTGINIVHSILFYGVAIQATILFKIFYFVVFCFILGPELYSIIMETDLCRRKRLVQWGC